VAEDCTHNLKDEVCALCDGVGPCNLTTHGWVCRDCLQRELDAADPNVPGSDPKKFPCRIVAIPCPHRRSWCLTSGKDFITVNGVLYCFDHRKDAQTVLGRLKGVDVAGIEPREMDALSAALYVMKNTNLMLRPVKDVPQASGERA